MTQAEIDSNGGGDGDIDNTATADSDRDRSGHRRCDGAGDAEPGPEHRQGGGAGGTADVAGETINYTMTVANTGNTTMAGVVVDDPFTTNEAPVLSGGFNVGDTDEDNLLDVGETWQYTASHQVTQAELDAGTDIVNTATVTGTGAAQDDDTATVTVTQTPPTGGDTTTLALDEEGAGTRQSQRDRHEPSKHGRDGL